MRKQIIFEEKQKTLQLSLEELELTADYRGERRHETSHHELFSKMMTDLSSRGYEAKIDRLFISQDGVINPTQREVDRSSDLSTINDIGGVIVRNCIGLIDIHGKEFNDDKTNQQIAISYNKQGIAMSMGTNVHICSNMNIFGGRMMSNYGGSSMPLMRMLDMMASWIQNMRKLRAADKAILEALQSTQIDPMIEVDQVIGNLHRLVEMNIKNKKVVSPLPHARIHDVQRGMMNYEGQLATAYDFYQAATEVSTHQDRIENRLMNTSGLGLYFQNRYGVEDAVEIDSDMEPIALT